MKKQKLFFAALFFSFAFLKAQDSTKLFHHEIGFNTVRVIKQLISNDPAKTLPMQPYDVFYNLYLYDTYGLRLGAGLLTDKTEASIEGETLPRTTYSVELNVRMGLSYNFIKTRRVAINAFADFLVANHTDETTTTTTTTPVFGDPVDEITTITSDVAKGIGFQAGVGVKYNFNKHLSLYLEVPYALMKVKSTSLVSIQGDYIDEKTTTNTTTTTISKIIPPTTLYLVLRF